MKSGKANGMLIFLTLNDLFVTIGRIMLLLS